MKTRLLLLSLSHLRCRWRNLLPDSSATVTVSGNEIPFKIQFAAMAKYQRLVLHGDQHETSTGANLRRFTRS